MAYHAVVKDLRYRLEAALAYLLYGLFRALPIDAASAIGGYVARLLGPLSSAQDTALQNLALAFPDKTQRDRQTILSAVWDNTGRVMAEYATLSRLREAEHDARIEIDGSQYLDALRSSDRPALFFSGHIGNWETIPLALNKLVQPPSIVYRSPNNPYVHSLIRRARGKSTASQIPKGSSGAREMIQVLRKNGHIALLIDQKMNTGLPIPFFGQDAMTGDAVARLALKVGCPIVPTRVERLCGCQFRVTFEEPWQISTGNGHDEEIHNLLARINNTLERWIRERPEQWLWLHNRWPKAGV